MVEYGEHVLSYRLSEPDKASSILIFAGVYDKEKMIDTRSSRKSGGKEYILSDDDGSWKYTVDQPEDDSWMAPDFDDSSWQAMIRCDFPEPGEKDYGTKHRLNKLREFGTCGLTISEAADCLWIRKVFSLSRS